MMEQLVGQSLDRYQIVSLLGEGGMGAVFKARDVTLQRDVAIKVMHPQFARQPNFQERFLQEARTAARLDHPGIVQVHDFGQARSHLYIVMKFIPGATLGQMLKDLKAQGRWIVLDEAVQLVCQVCLALDYAHRQGVLHRDIKPGNIMIEPEPSDGLPYRPVLTDLGLAKLAEGGLVTQEGTSMGTPAYMSPEQALGEKTDARSDVYSLGILLYELAVGRLPFPAKTISEAIRYHTKELPPPPRSIRPDLPLPVERVILRAIEKDPADRFPDAKALAEALVGILPEATAAITAPGALEGAVSLLTQYQASLVTPRGPSLLAEFPEAPPDLSQDRVVVMVPDQTARSFSMQPGGLTIGRAQDNDLVLENPKVSRYHARIEFDGSNYTITDLNSTNGTYLANAKLLPGVSEVWPPDTPLRVGDSWLRLERAQQPQATDDAVLRPDGTMAEPGRVRTSLGERVGVVMETTQLSVDPGSSVTASILLLNQGTLVDHFQTTLEGVPASWMPTPPPVVRLMPGQQQAVTFTIQPPRAPQSRAGQYPIAVCVTSQDAPDQVAKVPATLTVAAYHQFDLDLRPQKQSGTTAGTFRVHARNQGNTGLTLRFEALDPEDGCQYTFEPSQTVLPPGEERFVRLDVRAKAGLPRESARTFPFTVTARPAEAPELAQRAQGTWVQAPLAFEVSLHPQRQRGMMAGTFTVQVTNPGPADLTVRLEATDPEAGCLYTFVPPQVTVPAGQERAVQLNVHPKTPLPTAADRTYAFTVAARSVDASGLTRQVQGEWVHSAPAFEVSLHPQQQRGVSGGTFILQIRNSGDAELVVQLEVLDATGGCQYAFDSPQVVVPARQEQRVHLQVLPQDRKQAETCPFTVIARPANVPQLTQQVQGQWEQIPVVGWVYWIPWILASAIGACVGGVVGVTVNVFLQNAAFGIAGWAAVGAFVGIAQWLLLLGRIRWSVLWILASTIAWAIGAPLGNALCGPLGLGYTVCGLLAGLMQWPSLRGHREASLWILASAGGWCVGGFLGGVFSLLMVALTGEFVGTILAWTLGTLLVGAVAGAITGLPLVWLLRRPV